MSLPAPLMFTVGLIDQITAPIAKISKGLNGLASNYQAGTMQMASGIGGIAASGYALQNALMPAIEMDRALGEVKSLGVRQSALKMLTDTSYEYALKYGKSATDFVKSSYDIQSAIAGLNDANLSKFTLSSNVLAAATKADAATVTSYMGTMYGIFKNDAMQMGEGAWIERLTGMTATAVQAFKTDGKKMADAFGALGASAGLAPLEEQMAIMGTLQATMQGSESATKYKSFLAGVGKAQKALNLQFTDANGTMLPVVDILNKIKGKYGDVISVAEGDQLKTAFGSQEAVSMIELLLKDINGLNGSIESLGKVKGMEQAEKMAAAMTDQSQRLAQSWFVIRAAFGGAVLPAFNDFVSWIADMGSGVMDFTETFPTLTKVIGYLGIAMLSSIAIGGLFTAAMGGWKMAKVAWTTVTKLATWAQKSFTIANMRSIVVMGIEATMTWSLVAATKAYTLAMSIGAGVSKAFAISTAFLSGAFGTLRTAMIGFNIAALANPLFWIPAAIVAIGSLIYYWDEFKAAVLDTDWVKNIYNAIKAIFPLFTSLLERLADFVGVDIGLSLNSNQSSASAPSIAAISPVQTRVDKGGITQQMTTANQQKSTTIGNVTINQAKGDNVSVPAMLAMYS